MQFRVSIDIFIQIQTGCWLGIQIFYFKVPISAVVYFLFNQEN